MVDQVRTSLGSHFAPFFDRPVDANLVPDYYSVIKRPMDLGTLKSKLHDGHYSAPQHFAEVGQLALTFLLVLVSDFDTSLSASVLAACMSTLYIVLCIS